MYHHHFSSMDGMVEALIQTIRYVILFFCELLDFNWFSVQVIHNAVRIGSTFPAYLRMSLHWSPEYTLETGWSDVHMQWPALYKVFFNICLTQFHFIIAIEAFI